MKPWISLFSKLKAPYGKYSVLGNHDYGDYVQWKNKGEKEKNMEDMKTFQKEIGFELLLNENRLIKKDGEHISLIGVENWGKGGFKKVGDLKKASENLKKDDFKIVMTHDPSHWEAEILPHPFPFPPHFLVFILSPLRLQGLGAHRSRRRSGRYDHAPSPPLGARVTPR